MKKYSFILVLFSSFCALGVALPQCSTSEEQKKQTQMIESTQHQQSQKLLNLGQDIKNMGEEVNRLKLLIPEMTHILESQKKDLEDLKLQVQTHIDHLKIIESKIHLNKKAFQKK